MTEELSKIRDFCWAAAPRKLIADSRECVEVVFQGGVARENFLNKFFEESDAYDAIPNCVLRKGWEREQRLWRRKRGKIRRSGNFK
jgi:hypothetical protein